MKLFPVIGVVAMAALFPMVVIMAGFISLNEEMWWLPPFTEAFHFSTHLSMVRWCVCRLRYVSEVLASVSTWIFLVSSSASLSASSFSGISTSPRIH